MLVHVVLMAALTQTAITDAPQPKLKTLGADALLQTALHHEREWLATGDPQHAIQAAIFWEQRGDRGLALDCLLQVHRLADQLEPATARTIVDAQTRLQSELVPFSVVVEPGTAEGIEVSFERHGQRRARALQPQINHGLQRSFVQVSLDPGMWTVTAKAPGFEPAVRILAVTAQRPGESATLNLLATPGAEEVRARPYTLLVQRSSAMPRTPVTITAKPLNTSSAPVSCVIATYRDTCSLEVGRGPWQLAASAPAFVTTRISVTLTEEPRRPVVVELAPEPHMPQQSPFVDAPPNIDLQLARSTGIGVGVSGLAGLGLALGGQRQYNREIKHVRNDLNAGRCHSGNGAGQTCQARLIAPMRMRAAGFGLLGGAGGLALSSLALRFTRSKAAFFPLLATSVSATIAAGVWLSVRTSELDLAYSELGLTPGKLGEFDRAARERAYASMALGGGIGLLTGSVMGLVSRRRSRKVQASITTKPAGLAFSGDF